MEIFLLECEYFIGAVKAQSFILEVLFIQKIIEAEFKYFA
jgi:hypothetical protein